MKYIPILLLISILCSCDNTLQPEIISVEGKNVSDATDPILTHPELLTPLDSLTAIFSTKAKTIEFVGTLCLYNIHRL
ncbi:hypothetical protein [Fodinibius sediminis]|uniref:hypothetical protein n=1 Tax=Fodinibius sediminis TaxID=1214077 RepID=UPI00163DE232|nr:hypothetical protein [Fodinibius sediminis]